MLVWAFSHCCQSIPVHYSLLATFWTSTDIISPLFRTILPIRHSSGGHSFDGYESLFVYLHEPFSICRSRHRNTCWLCWLSCISAGLSRDFWSGKYADMHMILEIHIHIQSYLLLHRNYVSTVDSDVILRVRRYLVVQSMYYKNLGMRTNFSNPHKLIQINT
jgi:hypothetical protein